MRIADFFNDGPVTNAMTAAGNAALIAAMSAYAAAFAWILFRVKLSPENRNAIFGDFVERASWATFRWFWLLAIITAVPYEVECTSCARLLKESSFAGWAWDYRGIVTMGVSIGITFGVTARASAFIPFKHPYWKAAILLATAWSAGVASVVLGPWIVGVTVLLAVALMVLRLEQLK